MKIVAYTLMLALLVFGAAYAENTAENVTAENVTAENVTAENVTAENVTAEVAALYIADVNIEEAYVEIANDGDAAQSLENYTLKVDENEPITLGAIEVQPASSVKLFLGAGENTETEIYLNTTIEFAEAGNVTLMDPEGNEVSTVEYPMTE
ncbi:MAG: lamin tail domain-containing protein [Methanothrix sp.]|nr:lamin tail domain-containing protein [Methanothrix sp.]MCX8206891.1 lamin tail domain-containing protein [Methanothrix sp.]